MAVHSTSTVRFTALPCAHCGALVGWPRWALVDHGFRQSFCWPCYHQRQAEFTTENALDQACAIVRGMLVMR